MEKTSDAEDAIASENSKLIDIKKPVLEVANLNLTTDETITQNSAIVATHDKESSPATGYNGQVPVKEVNDKVKVQEDNDEWSTVPHNKSPSGRMKMGNLVSILTLIILLLARCSGTICSATTWKKKRLRKTFLTRIFKWSLKLH